MIKNVLVISSSLRKGSNSNIMSDYFVRGAKDSNHNVENINLSEINIKYCTGCLYCHKKNICIIKDDYANTICDKIRNADIIVFSTPTYFYGISGQLKVLLDRTNPLYTDNIGRKEVYLLISAAEDEEWVAKDVKRNIEGWTKCFDDISIVRTIFIGGVNRPNEIINFEDKLKKIYEIGKNI